MSTRKRPEEDEEPDDDVVVVSPPRLYPVRVLPRWRVCHEGRVYESGQVLALDLLTAAEWCAWGSLERARNLTDTECDELTRRWG